jgi:hypothetical protein
LGGSIGAISGFAGTRDSAGFSTGSTFGFGSVLITGGVSGFGADGISNFGSAGVSGFKAGGVLTFGACDEPAGLLPRGTTGCPTPWTGTISPHDG